MPTRMQIEREVRLAVVMYGGVSLAIYINGVTQELLNLVRATAPDPENPSRALHEEVAGTQKIYRRLGQILTEGGCAPVYDKNGPVRTRFVVDILSGTSAGGINAVFLAKALANGQDMEQLKSLWIDKADIEQLINDRESVKRVEGLKLKKPTESLLNSQRMYRELLDAFDHMDAPSARQAPHVDQLDLFVTTTDIRGLPLPLRLADMVVKERRHRHVLHFRYSGPNKDDSRNDFHEENNPFLAFACRCTSAFPFAFEPMRLSAVGAVLQGTAKWQDRSDICMQRKRWQEFFPDYPKKNQGSDKAYDFRERPFGDGGYLDNKPFTHAIEALPMRQGGKNVDRKLIYIEPSPEFIQHEKAEAGPNAFENVISAMTLAQYETIREDLERIIQRNRLIERVERIITGMEGDETTAAIEQPYREDFASVFLPDMIKTHGIAYGSYHRLKIAALTDEITEMIAGAAGVDAASDEFTAVRYFVRIWRDKTYTAYRDLRQDSGFRQAVKPRESQSKFLMDYDLPFRMRRLKFVLTKIDEFEALDKKTKKIFRKFEIPVPQNTEDRQAFRGELDSLRRALLKAHEILHKAYDDLRRKGQNKKPHPLTGKIAAVGITSEILKKVLDGHTEQDRRRLAKKFLSEPERYDAVCELASAIAEYIKKSSTDASRIASDAMRDARPGEELERYQNWARHLAKYYYRFFERYDFLAYPILYATGVGEELDPVEVVRISPKDAPSLIDERDSGRRKLAGTALMHFGAFLNRGWRWNDLLWGRLDGAERIITMLLPQPQQKKVRDQMIQEAQIAILSDEVPKADREELCRLLADALAQTQPKERSKTNIREFLERREEKKMSSCLQAALRANMNGSRLRKFFKKSYEVNREIDPQTALRSMARAAEVTGRVMENVADEYRVSKKPATWVVRLGRILWGLIEVAVPRSLPALLVRNLVYLLYTFEGLMIAGGILAKNEPVLRLGLLGLAVTFAVHLFVMLLRDLIRHKAGLWRTLKGLALFTVAVLALFGGYTAWQLAGTYISRWITWAMNIMPKFGT
jgi:patatin-related protein